MPQRSITNRYVGPQRRPSINVLKVLEPVRPEERVVYTRLCSRPLRRSLLKAAVTHARASRVVRRHHRATSLGNAGRHWFPGRAPATPTTPQPLRLSNVLVAQVERTGTQVFFSTDRAVTSRRDAVDVAFMVCDYACSRT